MTHADLDICEAWKAGLWKHTTDREVTHDTVGAEFLGYLSAALYLGMFVSRYQPSSTRGDKHISDLNTPITRHFLAALCLINRKGANPEFYRCKAFFSIILTRALLCFELRYASTVKHSVWPSWTCLLTQSCMLMK